MAAEHGDGSAAGADAALDVRHGLAAITGLLLIGLALLLRETFNMTPPLLPGYPGDAVFPRLVLVPTIVFAAIILLRTLVLGATAASLGYAEETITINWPSWLSVLTLCLAFAYALDSIGFEIAGFVLMMVLLVPRLSVAAGSHAPPARILAVATMLSLATVGTIYVTFVVLLKVPLPLLVLPAHVL